MSIVFAFQLKHFLNCAFNKRNLCIVNYGDLSVCVPNYMWEYDVALNQSYTFKLFEYVTVVSPPIVINVGWVLNFTTVFVWSWVVCCWILNQTNMATRLETFSNITNMAQWNELWTCDWIIQETY